MNSSSFARCIAGTALAAILAVAPLELAGAQPSEQDLIGLTASGSYLAARHASVERDARSAAAFYRSALRSDPKNSELLDRAFISSLAEGDIAAAVKLADRILVTDKSNRVARLVVGVHYLKTKKYAAAHPARPAHWNTAPNHSSRPPAVAQRLPRARTRNIVTRA